MMGGSVKHRSNSRTDPIGKMGLMVIGQSEPAVASLPRKAAEGRVAIQEQPADWERRGRGLRALPNGLRKLRVGRGAVDPVTQNGPPDTPTSARGGEDLRLAEGAEL